MLSLLLVMLELMVVLMVKVMVEVNLSGAIKRSLVRLENMTSRAGAG